MITFLAIYGARNSHILAIYGPRNGTILAIYGSGFRGLKSPKWCSFWDHKLPEYGYFWSFSENICFSFPPGPRQYLKVILFCFSIVIFKVSFM
jgi:hypothetical protein